MYQLVIKPILFWLNIESAQRLVIWALRLLSKLPFGRSLMQSLYRVEDSSLEREVLGLRFKNPIGVAAGFDVSGQVVEQLSDLGFGFVEVGAITPEPQQGDARPRIFRLPKDNAIINRMGHPNRGWAYAIERLRRRSSDVVVGCNIARNSNTPYSSAGREYLKSFRNLYQYVDYFTVNINYKHLIYGDEVTPQMALAEMLDPLFDFRRGQSDYRPILIKVSPDLTDELLDAVGEVLLTTPLDGVVAVNGTSSREGLQTPSGVVDKIGRGRLSGAPLRERALEVVRHIHKYTEGAYPIIGVGGVMSGEDVKAMLEAGASLVQIYTGFVYGGPETAGKMCRELIVKPEQTEDNQGDSAVEI